jgi:hypothetical protein
MVVVSGRLRWWIRRLDRSAEAIEWFVTKVLAVVLLVLCAGGLVWYSALELVTPDPWSGPNAVAARFGWQVWAAGAAGITGMVGLFVLDYIRLALVLPLTALSWTLARFRPDDPVRRTVVALPERARTALRQPAYTRTDITAPLRAAARRPKTWLFAAGGVALVAALAVGVAMLPPVAPVTEVSPEEVAAAEGPLRAMAAEIHAAIGSPPIHEDLTVKMPLVCNHRNRPATDPSRSGFGYLGTRPGVDPLDRMPQWAADLRSRGWAVTYPVRDRFSADDRMLQAIRDGFEVVLDAGDPPDLWIEVRGLC